MLKYWPKIFLAAPPTILTVVNYESILASTYLGTSHTSKWVSYSCQSNLLLLTLANVRLAFDNFTIKIRQCSCERKPANESVPSITTTTTRHTQAQEKKKSISFFFEKVSLKGSLLTGRSRSSNSKWVLIILKKVFSPLRNERMHAIIAMDISWHAKNGPS